MAKARDDEATLSVPITVEERAQRADIMAGLVLQIRAVRAQAKAKAFEFKEQVEALMDRLEAHSRVLSEGEENRRQMDLTFPQEHAAKALHDVAEAACSCEGGAEPDVHDPACPVHGVERNADGTAKDASECVKCDGDHGPPVCADPGCWQRDGDDEAPDFEDLAEEMRQDIGAAANTTESGS